jgi:tyrosyl-tRNA synthetase
VSVHALGTPLITKADGTKFGKTESGAIWLDPQMTSPYAFYQFWLNAEDAKVVDYLKVFTFRTREQIEELGVATQERAAAREAQRVLAAEVTGLVHGEGAVSRVQDASAALFGRGELAGLDEGTLADALAELPNARVSRGEHPVVDLMTAAGLTTSKGAARRTIQEGGGYLNNAKISDPDAKVGVDDLIHDRWLVVRRGRKTLAAVEMVG